MWLSRPFVGSSFFSFLASFLGEEERRAERETPDVWDAGSDIVEEGRSEDEGVQIERVKIWREERQQRWLRESRRRLEDGEQRLPERRGESGYGLGVEIGSMVGRVG